MQQTNKAFFFFPDRFVAFGLSVTVGLYVLSFFLPVTTVFDKELRGWDAFLVMACVPFEDPPPTTGDLIQVIFEWLPNPFFWLGIVLLALRRWHAATASGIIAVLGALSCLVDFGNRSFELGMFGPGYYVWLASMALLAGLGCWRTLYPGSPCCLAAHRR
jgi:hypothetical protein